MSFLDTLFSGAKALAKGLINAGAALVREILHEIGNSSFGKAVTSEVVAVAMRLTPVSRASDKPEAPEYGKGEVC